MNFKKQLCWKSIVDERPTRSGLYRVKARSDRLLPVKYAHYDHLSGAWIDDDGFWLPVDITIYIAYWAELDA